MPGDFVVNDLPVFFDTDDFGVVVTRYDGAQFNAQFYREYNAELGTEAYVTMLICRSSDTDGLKGGDRLKVYDTWYRISGPLRDDGTGVTELDLKEYVA